MLVGLFLEKGGVPKDDTYQLVVVEPGPPGLNLKTLFLD
jgi:hypothetical protein